MPNTKNDLVNIGSRVKYLRIAQGKTQAFLGKQVGFDNRTAGIRVAQYESGARKPKKDTIALFADAFGVAVETLYLPCIESQTQFIQLLFALEDLYLGGVSIPLDLALTKAITEWHEKKPSCYRGG